MPTRRPPNSSAARSAAVFPSKRRGILSAAGRHFATSVAGIRYLEGSYDRHLVRERLTVEDATFGYGGRAPALTGPGLGITVDADAVRRVTVRNVDVIQR